MKEYTYVVFRHGANAANQPMVEVSPVGIYAARNQWQARSLAEAEVGCYANQYFRTVPASRCSAAVVLEAEERQMRRQAEGV